MTTVTRAADGNVPFTELLRAIVQASGGSITSTSYTSVSNLNGAAASESPYPTDGRLAELADGTLVIGDGSTWEDASLVAHQTNGGINFAQRGDPTTDELEQGEDVVYASDGSGTGAAGDLVYAVNDGGTIKTLVLAQVSNATA